MMKDHTLGRREAMDEAVAHGDYSAGYEPSETARRLVAETLRPILIQTASSGRIRVLECGCGVGAWLDFVSRLIPDGPVPDLHGFDLNPRLIEVARKRLESRVPSAHLKEGDILLPESYGAKGQLYDLVFCYDVVQQLPRALQAISVERMTESVAMGGTLVVFDKDFTSWHGLKMILKKIFTKYLWLPFVPRYYLVARYPRLKRLRELAAMRGWEARVLASPYTVTRALVIHKGLG